MGLGAGSVIRYGIEGFTSHELGHTAINNWRLQGPGYSRIMAATGHEPLAGLKEYNPVCREECKARVREKR